MAWNPVADITGPQGPQGVKGDTGLTGPAGPAWTSPFTLAYSATLTPNANNGLYQRCSATGNPTLNPPTNFQDGMKVWIRIIASGGQRTVTLGTGIVLASGVASTLVIPSGKRGDIGLLFDSTDTATGFTSGRWTCLAASIQQ